MITAILIIAAAIVILFPAEPPSLDSFKLPAKSGPSYMEAVSAVQLIRTRLVKTDKCDDAVQKCLDTIMLALTNGSEK